MKKTDRGKKITIRINKRLYSLLCEIYSGQENTHGKDFISNLVGESLKIQFPQIGMSTENDEYILYDYKYENGKVNRKFTFNGIKKSPSKKKQKISNS